MEPYYSCAYGDLYRGDCLEVMPLLGQKFDLVLADPPFGTSACSWDTIIPFEDMWQVIHKSRNDNCPILFFGVEPFSSLLRCSNLKEYKYDWKWEKSSAANFLNFKYQPAKLTEDILVFSEDVMVFGNRATSYSKKGNLTYNPIMEKGEPYEQKSGKQKNPKNNATVRSEIKQVVTKNNGQRYPHNILRFNKDKDKFHQTQKPIGLLEYLIQTYSNAGDIVLDFSAGSSSTAIACINTNRKFIMIEKEEKYCEISAKRIEEHINKMWSDL